LQRCNRRSAFFFPIALSLFFSEIGPADHDGFVAVHRAPVVSPLFLVLALAAVFRREVLFLASSSFLLSVNIISL